MLARPSTGLLSGAIVGMLVVWIATSLGWHVGGPAASRSGVSEDAARVLVDEWSRFRSGTWVVDATYRRTASDGRSIGGAVREVQRPPDRLRTAMGSTDAMIGGYRYACATAPNDRRVLCRRGEQSAPYGVQVADELNALRRQVLGGNRRYDVERTGACFVLTARPGAEDEQWGRRTTLCFDSRSGAVARTKIERADVVDLTEARVISREVTDADLRLPG